MFEQSNGIQFFLPEWLPDFFKGVSSIKEIEDRMTFVIEASRRNIIEKTGGPFAAAIFETDSGKLISVGVNLVTTQGSSVLHAEMVAIMVAQQKIKTYDLGAQGVAEHELVASAEPCAMCLGAIPWSGVCRVVTGARDADARSIGFDEGAKREDWRVSLSNKRIEVLSDIKRDDARLVLEEYSRTGGRIYNSRESDRS